MADPWVFWLAAVAGVAFAVMLTLAGQPIVGLFLAGLIAWAGRAAESPRARKQTDETLRQTCNRLPFCDC